MKEATIHTVTLAFLFTLISCGTPVSEYEPKNQAEQEIKTQIIKFVDCRNSHDLEGLLALFCGDAKVMQGGLRNSEYLTKEQSREAWPETFKQMPSLEFSDPEMEVTGNMAVVTFKMSADGVKLKGTQHLVKENDRWLITEYSYEGEFASRY